MIRFDYHFRVRYRDIDQMGVMYYSRYYEHYEAARTDMMRHLGLSYRELEEQGIMMPVVHSQSDYYSGPGFEDDLICRTEVNDWPRGRMEINYTVVRRDEPDKVLNTGKTVHAFVKSNGRPTRMPAALEQVLKKRWIS